MISEADKLKRQLILQAEQKLLAAKAQLNEAKLISNDLNQSGLGGAAGAGKRQAVKVDRTGAVSPQLKEKDKKEKEKGPKLGFFGKRKEDKEKKKDKK